MIITIDGPVATGKSSIAKKLASSIGYIYFDTGAMYRALTYGLIKNNINPDDLSAVLAYLEKFDFRISVIRGDRHYFLNQEDVSHIIRGDSVTKLVSKVSAISAVREKCMAMQRELAKGVNAVFEGRDMGTVVFPDANLKIFLTGRPETRAKRRYEEMLTKYPDQAEGITLEKMLEDINLRDSMDSTRELSPLRQPEDAFVVDTSDLTIDEIVFKILEFKDTIKLRNKAKE